MARLKARTGILSLLLLLCGTAGYILHAVILRHTTTSPLHPDHTDTESAPARGLGEYVKWSRPPRLDQHHQEVKDDKAKKEAERLVFDDNGLVRNWEDGHEKGYARSSSRVRHSHPIYRLIEEGQEKWANLLQRYAIFAASIQMFG
jgi:hypothetical protein